MDFKEVIYGYLHIHPLAYVWRTMFGPIDISLYDNHSLSGRPKPLVRLSIAKEKGLPKLGIRGEGVEIYLYTKGGSAPLSVKEVKLMRLCLATVVAYRAWTRYRDAKMQGETLFVNEFVDRIGEDYVPYHLAQDTRLGFPEDKAPEFMQFVLEMHLGVAQI